VAERERGAVEEKVECVDWIEAASSAEVDSMGLGWWFGADPSSAEAKLPSEEMLSSSLASESVISVDEGAKAATLLATAELAAPRALVSRP
jgi:hypothetical protein